MKIFLPCALLIASCLSAADFPQAEISNSVIHARLYLPDPQKGYYQATRFDWSGLIASLEWKGHNFFGQWFEKYDPKVHESVVGPVEEFLTNGAGLGYQEAKPGETFVKIGVGAIRKPEEPRFRQFSTYEIVDNGKWSVRTGPDFIEFTQALPAANGYAYLYTKTVRLTKGKPELVLEHRLKNTGAKVIESSVYQHDFFMIDGLPTGPGTVIRFPFDVRATRDMRGLAEARGKEIDYLKELDKGQTAASDLEGFGSTASDYDIRVENRKAGAGIRQVSDQPIEKLYLWSIRTTVCPEAFIHMKIEPGKEFAWRIAYEFYAVNP